MRTSWGKAQAGPHRLFELPAHWPGVLSTSHTHLCLLSPVRRLAPRGQDLPLSLSSGPLPAKTPRESERERIQPPREAGEIFKLTLLFHHWPPVEEPVLREQLQGANPNTGARKSEARWGSRPGSAHSAILPNPHSNSKGKKASSFLFTDEVTEA